MGKRKRGEVVVEGKAERKGVQIVNGEVREVHHIEKKTYQYFYSFEEWKSLLVECQSLYIAPRTFHCVHECKRDGRRRTFQRARLNIHRRQGCPNNVGQDRKPVSEKMYPTSLWGNKTVDTIQKFNSVEDIIKHLVGEMKKKKKKKKPAARQPPKLCIDISDDTAERVEDGGDDVGEAIPEDDVDEASPEDGVDEAIPEDGVDEAIPEDGVDEAIPEDGVDEAIPEDGIDENGGGCVGEAVHVDHSGLVLTPEAVIARDRQQALEESRRVSVEKYPYYTVQEPKSRVDRTGLTLLLDHSLFGDNEVPASWHRETFRQYLGEFLVSPTRLTRTSLALGGFHKDRKRNGVYDGEDQRLAEEITDVLDNGHVNQAEVFRLADDAFFYYKSVADWKEYETKVQSLRQDVERLREKWIVQSMTSWEANRVKKIEAAGWGWHPLFHVCVDNPIVAKKMPSMPWRHNREEATSVARSLTRDRTLYRRPFQEARILRLFILCNKIKTSMADPVNGATEERMRQWVDTPGAMDVAAALLLWSGWCLFGDEALARENTEEAVHHAKNRLLSGEAVDEVRSWVDTVQARALEDFVLHYPEDFIIAWTTTKAPNDGTDPVWWQELCLATERRQDWDLYWFNSKHVTDVAGPRYKQSIDAVPSYLQVNPYLQTIAREKWKAAEPKLVEGRAVGPRLDGHVSEMDYVFPQGELPKGTEDAHAGLDEQRPMGRGQRRKRAVTKGGEDEEDKEGHYADFRRRVGQSHRK